MTAEKTQVKTGNGGVVSAVSPVVEVVNIKTTKVYPYKETFRVIIKPKLQTSILPEVGSDSNSADTYSNYIGPCYAGFKDPRPLGRTIFTSFEEEEKFMKPIIGIDSKHTKYNETLDTYWTNISIPVDRTGLELEAGKNWINEKEWVPINNRDYVLYLYCLKYHRVANTREEADNSRRILFYMWTEEEERTKNRITRENKDKATIERLKIVADPLKVKAVLTVGRQVVPDNIEDQIINLGKFSDSNPNLFIRIVEDKFLMDKFFVEECVANGLLIRPIDTFIHISDGVTIGNTMEETIAYLTNSTNLPLRRELEGKLKLKLEGKI